MSIRKEGGDVLRNTVLEAKDIWKKSDAANAGSPWLLRGIQLEIMEGDFIAVLGGPGSGKSALLKVLGFREPPEQGAVYFEGRLVGRSGTKELDLMRSERVWLVNGTMNDQQILVKPQSRLAAVLIDEPAALLGPDSAELLERLQALTRSGVAVVLATREPAVASLAPVIYKLSGGSLEKLTGKSA